MMMLNYIETPCFYMRFAKNYIYNEREKELKEQSSFKTKFAFHLFVSV